MSDDIQRTGACWQCGNISRLFHVWCTNVGLVLKGAVNPLDVNDSEEMQPLRVWACADCLGNAAEKGQLRWRRVERVR